MKVHAELVDHPKYLRLKRAVGEGALECLIRLWGHCESNQRGEYWKKADPEYVEHVCRWTGAQGVLFEALVASGWIDSKPQGISVHDWNETNWRAVFNWKIGRSGGRPQSTADRTVNPKVNPKVNRTDTPGLTQRDGTVNPMVNPDRTSSLTPLNEGMNEGMNEGGERARARGDTHSSSVCEWPTRAQWHAAAEMEGMPPHVEDGEWQNQERKVPADRWKGIDPDRLRHHAAFVIRKWRERGAPGPGGQRSGSPRPLSAAVGNETTETTDESLWKPAN